MSHSSNNLEYTLSEDAFIIISQLNCSILIIEEKSLKHFPYMLLCSTLNPTCCPTIGKGGFNNLKSILSEDACMTIS